MSRLPGRFCFRGLFPKGLSEPLTLPGQSPTSRSQRQGFCLPPSLFHQELKTQFMLSLWPPHLLRALLCSQTANPGGNSPGRLNYQPRQEVTFHTLIGLRKTKAHHKLVSFVKQLLF